MCLRLPAVYLFSQSLCVRHTHTHTQGRKERKKDKKSKKSKKKDKRAKRRRTGSSGDRPLQITSGAGIPPTDYSCSVCARRGHWTKDCPLSKPQESMSCFSSRHPTLLCSPQVSTQTLTLLHFYLCASGFRLLLVSVPPLFLLSCFSVLIVLSLSLIAMNFFLVFRLFFFDAERRCLASSILLRLMRRQKKTKKNT